MRTATALLPFNKRTHISAFPARGALKFILINTPLISLSSTYEIPIKSIQYAKIHPPEILSQRNFVMKQQLKIAALTAVISLTLAGCASNPDSAANLAADAKYSQTIVQINELKQAIDSADKSLAKGAEDELPWFATQDIEEAKKALAETKEYYSKFEFDPSKASTSTSFFGSTTYLEAANTAIKTFNQHMNNAVNLKIKAQSTLPEAFDYRAQLKTLNAKQYFPGASQELEDNLKKLVDQIANNKAQAAVSAQPALVAKMRALEVKTVTAIYLTDAKNALDKLMKTDATQHAPKSLSQAMTALTAATAFAATQPRAIDDIKRQSENVMFAVNRAKQIALTVKKLKTIQPKDYEDYIVGYEKVLLSISNALNAEDRRDLTFEEQGKELVSFIETNLKGQEASLQAQQLRKELKDQKTYSVLLEEKISTLTNNLEDMKKALADALAKK
jgi:hypothetical protein